MLSLFDYRLLLCMAGVAIHNAVGPGGRVGKIPCTADYELYWGKTSVGFLLAQYYRV